MHDLAGLTNLKSASGLGISGYSAMRERVREWWRGGMRTQREREREKLRDRVKEKESMCDGDSSDAVEADAVFAAMYVRAYK